MNDGIDIHLLVTNQLPYYIWVKGNATFIQGKEIIGFFGKRDEYIGAMQQGSSEAKILEISNIKSKGTIVLTISYEGFYLEGGVEKPLNSGGSVHEIHIEVKESVLFWPDIIQNLIYFGSFIFFTIVVFYYTLARIFPRPRVSKIDSPDIPKGSHILAGYTDYRWLQRHVEREVRGRVLDIAIGSGVLAIAAAKKPEVRRVVAVIMNPKDLGEDRERAASASVSEKIVFRQGDLFQPVGEERFDYILFNPPDSFTPDKVSVDPYSKEDMLDISIWHQEFYRRTEELIKRFLKEARNHLRPGGRILLKLTVRTGLFLTKGITPKKIERDYKVEILEEVELGFERFYILSLGERTKRENM
ncbi:MAG: methyltransferase [Candidatus Bathyarchaeia archaeon]